MAIALAVGQSVPVTTSGPVRPQPEWRMPLYGIPCEYCWTPAKALVVYKDYRYVLHQDSQFKPCVAANPKAVPFEPVLPPRRKVPAAKRKVGRPPTSGKYTRDT